MSDSLNKAPRYITTPIYYLNDKPHLGHAYTTIAADFLARFWRLEGRPTYFLTGTDEHGQKIERAAQAQGVAPQVYVDQVAALFRDMTRAVGAEPDDFIRTTEARHTKGAQAFWRALEDAGFIYRGTYAGWYAVRDEAYYAADEIQDGKSPTGAPVEWVEEVCYFFKLSAFQKPLLDFYAAHPDFIAPASRYNEVKRWVERGLQDLAISRSTFSWGVPVPQSDTQSHSQGDTTQEDTPQGPEKHVMYVWVEALANYITALGYPDTGSAHFTTFWPQALHLVGKDILRFHGVYWPAFLMAAGLPMPKRLFAHGWWTNEGQKISKSLGNVIDPLQLIEVWGVDVFRYFVLREISFGGDGDFSEAALKRRFTSDLANDLGNLAQRVLAFIQKHWGGRVPSPYPKAALSEGERLKDWTAGLLPRLQACVEAQHIHRYLEIVWEGIALGNQFVDTLKPWALVKSDDPAARETLEEGLSSLLELLRWVGLVILPAMPAAAHRLLDQLGVPVADRHFTDQSKGYSRGTSSLLPPRPLFPKG